MLCGYCNAGMAAVVIMLGAIEPPVMLCGYCNVAGWLAG